MSLFVLIVELFQGVQYQELGNQLLEDDLSLRFNQKSPRKLFSQPAYGFAWIARKDFINQYQLYDRAILGGSDIFFTYALVNGMNRLIEAYQSVGWSAIACRLG